MEERVVFVELYEGRPYSVVTKDSDGHLSSWDFDYCRTQDEIYYHNTGSGYLTVLGSVDGKSSFWVAPGIEVNNPDGIPQVQELPAPWSVDTLFESCSEGTVIYCTVCGDLYPKDGPTCQHLRYIPEYGWCGCGVDEDDLDFSVDVVKNHFLALCDYLGPGVVSNLREALVQQEYEVTTLEDFFGVESWHLELSGDKIYDIIDIDTAEKLVNKLGLGLAWLWSLEASITVDAEKQTMEWIDVYYARRNAQAA